MQEMILNYNDNKYVPWCIYGATHQKNEEYSKDPLNVKTILAKLPFSLSIPDEQFGSLWSPISPISHIKIFFENSEAESKLFCIPEDPNSDQGKALIEINSQIKELEKLASTIHGKFGEKLTEEFNKINDTISRKTSNAACVENPYICNLYVTFDSAPHPITLQSNLGVKDAVEALDKIDAFEQAITPIMPRQKCIDGNENEQNVGTVVLRGDYDQVSIPPCEFRKLLSEQCSYT